MKIYQISALNPAHFASCCSLVLSLILRPLSSHPSALFPLALFIMQFTHLAPISENTWIAQDAYVCKRMHV